MLDAASTPKVTPAPAAAPKPQGQWNPQAQWNQGQAPFSTTTPEQKVKLETVSHDLTFFVTFSKIATFSTLQTRLLEIAATATVPEVTALLEKRADTNYNLGEVTETRESIIDSECTYC